MYPERGAITVFDPIRPCAAGCWGVVKLLSRTVRAAVTGDKEQLDKDWHPVPASPQEEIYLEPGSPLELTLNDKE